MAKSSHLTTFQSLSLKQQRSKEESMANSINKGAIEVDITANTSDGDYQKAFGEPDFIVTVGDHSIEVTDAWNIMVDNNKIVNHWVHEVRKLYASKKSKNHLVVGLSAQRSNCYLKNEDAPFDVLQLCIGSHCLLYDLHSPRIFKRHIPKELARFLSDPNVTFVGVGMEDVLEKFQKDLGVSVAKTVELRKLASKRFGISRWGLHNLEQLAKVVLEIEVAKPKVGWRFKKNQNYYLERKRSFQDEMLASAEAFLALEMGKKLQVI